MKQENRLKDIEEWKDFLISKGFIFTDKIDSDIYYFNKKVTGIDYVFSLTSPHSGSDYKWVFRANRKDTFERWSCCEYEEFYKDIGGINFM